jgi:hypothetical protein
MRRVLWRAADLDMEYNELRNNVAQTLGKDLDCSATMLYLTETSLASASAAAVSDTASSHGGHGEVGFFTPAPSALGART